MTDLEDRILKKNIPGKYSQWDEYKDNLRSEENEDEENEDGSNRTAFEQVQKWENDNLPKPLQISAMASNNSVHSTGAKGVLNDYRIHKQNESYRHQMEEEEKQKILSRVMNGAYLKPCESSISAASLNEAAKLKKMQSETKDKDDFCLIQYRKQRLNQMKLSHSLPCYGNFLEMETPNEYVDIIENTDPRISLIIHIYEPSIAECNLLNQHLDHLARNDLKLGTRFVRIRAFTLKSNFDVIGLPALLLYRNSNLIQNWTRIVDYFSRDRKRKFMISDVQELLEPVVEDGLQMIKSDIGIENRMSATKTSSEQVILSNNQTKFEYDDYDSDDAELDALCADFVPTT